MHLQKATRSQNECRCGQLRRHALLLCDVNKALLCMVTRSKMKFKVCCAITEPAGVQQPQPGDCQAAARTVHQGCGGEEAAGAQRLDACSLCPNAAALACSAAERVLCIHVICVFQQYLGSPLRWACSKIFCGSTGMQHSRRPYFENSHGIWDWHNALNLIYGGLAGGCAAAADVGGHSAQREGAGRGPAAGADCPARCTHAAGAQQSVLKPGDTLLLLCIAVAELQSNGYGSLNTLRCFWVPAERCVVQALVDAERRGPELT